MATAAALSIDHAPPGASRSRRGRRRMVSASQLRRRARASCSRCGGWDDPRRQHARDPRAARGTLAAGISGWSSCRRRRPAPGLHRGGVAGRRALRRRGRGVRRRSAGCRTRTAALQAVGPRAPRFGRRAGATSPTSTTSRRCSAARWWSTAAASSSPSRVESFPAEVDEVLEAMRRQRRADAGDARRDVGTVEA